MGWPEMKNVSLCLLVSLATACATGKGAQTSAPKELPSLPRAFGKVSWASGPAELASLFPNGQISESANGNGVTTVTGVNMETFEDANVEVSGPKGEPATKVEISTADHRKACVGAPSDQNPPCRNRYGPELELIYERLHVQLYNAYGDFEPPENKRKADPRERMASWKAEGHHVKLALAPRNGKGWAVWMTATREESTTP
jgi:hypothetical protein